MIRFVNLKGKIFNDEDNYFAWYDTITERFLEFSGHQIFISWEDFEEEFNEFLKDDLAIRKHNFTDLERFRKLFDIA